MVVDQTWNVDGNLQFSIWNCVQTPERSLPQNRGETRDGGKTNEYEKDDTHTQQTGGEGGKMQSIYATERLEDETGGRGGNDKKQTARLGVGSILSTKTRDRVKRRRDFFITWLLNDY